MAPVTNTAPVPVVPSEKRINVFYNRTRQWFPAKVTHEVAVAAPLADAADD